MTGMITNHVVRVLLVLLHASSLVSGIFIQFYMPNAGNSSDGFRIPFSNLDVDFSHTRIRRPPGMGINLRYYRNISALSADERCLSGKPLGAAVAQVSPYVLTPGYFDKKTYQMIFDFNGIVPALLKRALKHCCHENSTIEYARLMLSQKDAANSTISDDYDFYFPLYGESMEDRTYQDNPFIPIIQAPSVVLLVFSEDVKVGKTELIVHTVLKTWPLLFFILLTASSSGIVIWFLDHWKNEDHFPKNFLRGAWEGFWWAFITMTTVGYGDRSPKTVIGRLFCICWIIFGVVTLSVFYGLITADIYASTQQHFEIRGAKIAAVSGSREFMLGISLNADMIEMKSNIKAVAELMNKTIDGLLIDNYIATYFGKEIEKRKLRRDRIIKYPITYGMMLGKNSRYIDKCVRKYINDNPQGVFEIVSEKLKPKRNPADSENLQLKEAERLFYQDDAFRKIVKIGGIILGCILGLGIYFQLLIYCCNKGKKKPEKFTHHIVEDSSWNRHSFQGVDGSLKDLIEQYKCFQDGWMNKLTSIQNE